MKKIKLFPAPHVEIRIHVSEEMEMGKRKHLRHGSLRTERSERTAGRNKR